MQKPKLRMIAYAVLTRPYQVPYFLINKIISDFKQSLEDDKRKHKERLAKEKRENEQSIKDSEDYDFFKNNVHNSELMNKGGGLFNVEPGQIGKVLINNKDKTIKVEIRQTARKCIREGGAIYQIPLYSTGHLLCENAEYEIIESEYGDAVFMSDDKNNPGQVKPYGNEFTLRKDDKNPARLSLTIINNLQGIKIVCDRISAIDYKDVKVDDMEKHREIVIGCSYGKFFSIQYE
ncbi:MAG: hypothetical protein ACOX0C_02140 [Patescibacteria group bacterium]